NGNVFVTGTSRTVKLAPGGTPLWTAPYGGRAVAADTNGNSYVTGFSELDYATVKLDSNGSNLWLRTFSYFTSTNVPDISQVVAVTPNGTLAVSGLETRYVFRGGSYVTFRTIGYSISGSETWSNDSLVSASCAIADAAA